MPWLDDHKCENFRVVFSKTKFLPLIGLASFPRSGNTWIRYLIEGATGVFTGSFYNSGCMVSQGKIVKSDIDHIFYYYYDMFSKKVYIAKYCFSILGYFGDAMPVYSGTTCLIKTHGYFNTPATNRRDLQTKPEHTDFHMSVTRRTGIVLIRNPFRVLYSFRNYNVMGLHGHADASEFKGTGI